jgi:DNA-binding winged helix-turn-helix (wHTH) protein
MIYAFGDYKFDTHLYELRYVGRSIKIEPQVLKVLTYLVQHRDRVISRQELLEKLWSNPYVVDEALGRCIREARQALGDRRNAPQCILTVPRFGYRFIAPVEEHDHLTIPPPQNPQSPPQNTPIHSAERKPVTVLVCVLADAARLAARLEPEAIHSLIQELFALAQSEVQQYGGTITQFRGGGLMALFGMPLAHEDHARRAVLAALGMQQRLCELAAIPGLPLDESFRVRMGLHTGLMLVGNHKDVPQMLYTAVGDTIHLMPTLTRTWSLRNLRKLWGAIYKPMPW